MNIFSPQKSQLRSSPLLRKENVALTVLSRYQLFGVICVTWSLNHALCWLVTSNSIGSLTASIVVNVTVNWHMKNSSRKYTDSWGRSCSQLHIEQLLNIHWMPQSRLSSLAFSQSRDNTFFTLLDNFSFSPESYMKNIKSSEQPFTFSWVQNGLFFMSKVQGQKYSKGSITL